MLLKELRISYNAYGKDEGKHTGTIEFTESDMRLAIKLSPEHCDRIFKICANALMQTSAEAADKLTANILDHQKKLEDKNESES